MQTLITDTTALATRETVFTEDETKTIGRVELTLRDRVLSDFSMLTRAGGDAAHDALRSRGHETKIGARVAPGDWNPIHLEAVRDDIRRRTEDEQHTDIEKTLALWHVDFRGARDLPLGRIAGRVKTPQGLSAAIPFTRRALQQLCRDALPSRGLGFLTALSDIDSSSVNPKGPALATATLAKFLRVADRKPRRVRCYLREDVDGVKRLTARCVVSQSYASYDDLQLVEALLNTPEFAELPVLAYRSTDAGMRLRVALHPMSEPPAVGVPVQMLEAWNSEVGSGSVALKGGAWILHCTNGLAGWESSMCWRWNHSGNVKRIANGVPQAIEELRTRSSGILDLYDAAVDTFIDDAISWMDDELSELLSEPARKRTRAALLDDVMNPAPANSLARVVNAITYAAQGERDIYAQERFEHVGGAILTRGLSKAIDRRLYAPKSS